MSMGLLQSLYLQVTTLQCLCPSVEAWDNLDSYSSVGQTSQGWTRTIQHCSQFAMHRYQDGIKQHVPVVRAHNDAPDVHDQNGKNTSDSIQNFTAQQLAASKRFVHSRASCLCGTSDLLFQLLSNNEHTMNEGIEGYHGPRPCKRVQPTAVMLLHPVGAQGHPTSGAGAGAGALPER